MKTFGAELVGNQKTLPRTRLLQQLKKHRGRAAFRHEQERRERVFTELRQARLTGIRFKVPAESLSSKLANLPDGVSVERGRIEVRFDGAKDAMERLYALAHALVNDYERFEALVDGRGEAGGEALRPDGGHGDGRRDRAHRDLSVDKGPRPGSGTKPFGGKLERGPGPHLGSLHDHFNQISRM